MDCKDNFKIETSNEISESEKIYYDIYFKSLDDILNKGKEWKAWTYSDFDKKNMFKFIKKYRLTHPVTILKKCLNLLKI